MIVILEALLRVSKITYIQYSSSVQLESWRFVSSNEINWPEINLTIPSWYLGSIGCSVYVKGST